MTLAYLHQPKIYPRKTPVDKKLYCFPDTNLFIQCKPLHELDWSSLGEFNEIDVIVTRPVQKELDSHKGKGNTRVASRARAAASVLQEFLIARSAYKEVRQKSPCVRLYVRLDFTPDSGLADILNYNEADDQLVGVVAGFQKTQSNDNVCLLTGDIGPMASATAASVPFASIPDSWFLQPEEDANIREIKRLTQEVAQYKKSEPEFSLRWLEHGVAIERVNGTFPCYTPLAPDEIEELMQRIVQCYPLVTNFDGEKAAHEASDSDTTRAFGVDIGGIGSTLRALNREVFAPATESEISVYKTMYAKWLQECKDFLINLHIHLAKNTPWPRVTAEIQNIGIRSAEDALVTFSVAGDFFIQPLKKADPDANSEIARLSPAPKAPEGKWRNQFSHLSRSFASLADVSMMPRPFVVPHSQKREDDSFYYKPSRPSRPVGQYSLECALWRHQSDAEIFEITLHPELKSSETSGVVEINIQSTNLSKVFTRRIPVKMLIQPKSLLECAHILVENLIAGR